MVHENDHRSLESESASAAAWRLFSGVIWSMCRAEIQSCSVNRASETRGGKYERKKRRSEVRLKPSNSETGLMFRVDEPWSRIRRSRLSTRKEPKETWGSFSVKEIKRELITGGGYQSLSVSPRHNPGFPDLQPSSPRSLRSAQPSLIFLKQGNPRPDELRGGSRSSSAS